MKGKYSVLLLDFDGVLSDSLLVCMREFNRIVEEWFPTIPKVFSQSDMTGVYSVQLRHSLYPFGLDDAETKQFFRLHSLAMSKCSAEVEPFKKVVKGLTKCKLPKAIITSSYSPAVVSVLTKSLDYDDELINLIVGREMQATKTEKIRLVLEQYRTDMNRALYVGDMVSDILYCRDVPIDIASVGYGYHPAEYLRKFDPTYILETEDNFVEFLAEL